MEATGRKVQVNGVTLNVLVAGEGPDVVLLHGFPDTHRVWRRQIPVLLAAGYRVIAPDARGCGESEMLPRVDDYRVERLVEDLVGLFDLLGLGRVRLVAHDLGAVVAWQLAMAHPERVDRYVALSVGHPAAYARGGWEQKLRAYYILLVQARGLAEYLLTRWNWAPLRWMTRFADELPEWRATLSRPGRLRAHLDFYRANLRLIWPREYPTVRVPVLGIWSTEDIALVERQMVESERYVDARWRYVRLEGANHWLQLTAADELNALLLDYLR